MPLRSWADGAALTLKREHARPGRSERGDDRHVNHRSKCRAVPSSSHLSMPWSATNTAALALIKEKVELSAITAGASGDADVLALGAKCASCTTRSSKKNFRAAGLTASRRVERRAALLDASEYPPGRVTPTRRSTVDEKFLEQSARYLEDAGARHAPRKASRAERRQDMRDVAAALSVSRDDRTAVVSSQHRRRAPFTAAALRAPLPAKAVVSHAVRPGSTIHLGRSLPERLTASLGKRMWTIARRRHRRPEAVWIESPADGYTSDGESNNAINQRVNPKFPLIYRAIYSRSHRREAPALVVISIPGALA